VAGGVGPVAAAVSTAMALAKGEYGLVVSAGIAGGFAGRAAIGEVVVSSSVRWADLGAATDEGFLDLAGLGLTGGEALTSPALDRVVSALEAAGVPAHVGEILTLATMTGTDQRAADLASAHPAALAEAMEGYGVASAAAAAGVPWVEVRAVSNLIGRRDRSTWNIPAAFSALRRAVGAVIGAAPTL
jgi:futalosine hydrolase